MKFTSTMIAVASLLISTTSTLPVQRRGVDPTLVPDVGHKANTNPTGTGDCDGAVTGPDGKPIKVPCACPPSPEAIIEALNKNLDNGGIVVNNPGIPPIKFPTGDTPRDKLDRISAVAITLQNLDGPGKGCPIAATTLGKQAKEIEAQLNGAPVLNENQPATGSSSTSVSASASQTTTDTTPTSPPAGGQGPNGNPPPPDEKKLAGENQPPAGDSPSISVTTSQTAAAPGETNVTPGKAPSVAELDKLVPAFGHERGLNPTGSGDCDGIIGPKGEPIKIPCNCPPERAEFLKQLEANIAAGRAVNNSEVKISFPLGDSKQDKIDRITASLITLQNLSGPGKGCPAVSTTFGKQQKELQNSA